LGGGQMAEAILNALNEKGLQKMKQIFVYDINIDRLNFLEVNPHHIETKAILTIK
jgi:pyrroline-5-carboxylate reductase